VANRAGDERFFGGPRFGRSGAATVLSGSNDVDGRHPERFFIGSRYGKRSEMASKIRTFISARGTCDDELTRFADCFPLSIGSRSRQRIA